MPDGDDEEEEAAAGGELLSSRSTSDHSQQKRQPEEREHRADRFKLVYEPSPIVPPDGGYGWVVVAASFIVNLMADGVTFSFGILLSELFTSLDDSREDISWIGSFLAGVPLLVGPVTSVLIERFGCRSVTIVGGLISGLGFALMFILPRSTVLFVFAGGLLAGFGLGLAFMPAVVAVSFYFVEKRSLATGLSMSGSGVGTIVFAYITRACIDEYTWRGSFLVIGGILLNMCVCGALYRPLRPDDFKEMKRMKRLYVQFQQANDFNNSAVNGGDCSKGKSVNGSRSPSISPSTSSPGSSQSGSPTSRRWHTAAGVAGSVTPAKSLLSIPTYLTAELSKLPTTSACQKRSTRFAVSTETPPLPDEKRLIAGLKLGYLQRLAVDCPDNSNVSVHSIDKRPVAAAATSSVVNDNTVLENTPIVKANTSHELVDYAQQVSRQQKQKRRMEFKQQQNQKQQQQQQHSEENETKQLSIVVCLPQLPQPHQPQLQSQSQNFQPQRPRFNTLSQTVRRQLFPVDRRYFIQHTKNTFSSAMQIELWDSCPEFGRLPPPAARHNQRTKPPCTAKVSMLSKLQRSLRNSKTFKHTKFLFTSWDYVSFLASNFLLYFWYDITYTFLPDHAKEIGLSSSDVSLIIASIGVSNTIGQIVIGYIGDFPRVNTVLLYALCMSLTGVANFLVPWCHSLASLLVYGILYGFLVSANYALCSIVIIDLFSLERLTTGYGFMMFFQGFANLVGPPTMGYMRDSDTNYNRAYIYSGIFVLVSNLLILSIYPTIYRWVRNCCCTSQHVGNNATDNFRMKSREAEEEAAEPLTPV